MRRLNRKTIRYNRKIDFFQAAVIAATNASFYKFYVNLGSTYQLNQRNLCVYIKRGLLESV